MNVNSVRTPCLIVDIEKVSKNISRMHRQVERLGVKLRPHAKTAKNINILKMALDGQAGGITVSTLKEAEYFFQKGISDIVYAVGISPQKVPPIVELVRKGADVKIILDSREQVYFAGRVAEQYGVVVSALIEIDCDGHRSGVGPNSDELLDLGAVLSSTPGIELKGILTHAGESYHAPSLKELKKMACLERDAAVSAAKRLSDSGYPCELVSVGSTPTALFADDLTGVTEVRAGNFMFFDLFMAGVGVCSEEDIALSVLTSVIGHQEKKNWLITDSGWMALSRDRGTAKQKKDQGYGLIMSENGEILDDLITIDTSQEHGIISSRSGRTLPRKDYPVGTLLRILPNHACATATMYDQYHIVGRNNEITDIWDRIRGW
jgi:D-serine deaminase-like pyridoxal phosphate-dependent protein